MMQLHAGPEMSAIEVLTTTRSVRKRLDLERPVDTAVVEECLEIALQAPSGSNRQGWQFLVIDDEATRAAIGEIYRQTVEAYLASPGSAARLFADQPDRATVQARVGDSVAYLGEVMGRAPVLVIGCIQTADASLPEGNQASLWGSLLPAAWSFMLALRSRGLVSAWTTLHLAKEREVAEILGLPANVHQGVLLPVAHPIGNDFHPAARTPLAQVLHRNHW
jgi:nitroreductase